MARRNVRMARFFSAVAEIRVDLNCESASIRGEIEAEIVTQLDSLLRDGCIERDEQDVDHLNQTLARLGRDAQLAAIRQVNNCLTAYVICLSTAAVEGLRKLYTGGELRSVLEEIFIGLLGFTTSIVVGGLDWSSQNYEKCLKAMLITTGSI